MSSIGFALRTLGRTPGFTITVTLSLALGLALTATTVAVTNAYLVRSLPYPAADRLYHVVYAPQGQPEPRGMTGIDWKSLEDAVEVPDSSSGTRFYLSDAGYTVEALGLLVAPGALEALRVRAVSGRSFQPEDFDPGAGNVALISHSLWRERFGSDEGVVGRQFSASLNDQGNPPQTFRIVGILPPDFRYVRELARNMEILAPLRSPMRVYMVRLGKDVPRTLAESRITEAARSVSSPPAGWGGVRLEPVHARYVAAVRPALLAITIAASLVLVIVSANVAVLMLLRATQRQKEMSVRVALGASRADVFRIVFGEMFLVCTAALIAGALTAEFALRALGPLIEEHLQTLCAGIPGPQAIAYPFEECAPR